MSGLLAVSGVDGNLRRRWKLGRQDRRLRQELVALAMGGLPARARVVNGLELRDLSEQGRHDELRGVLDQGVGVLLRP
jgi:hypothetical protein